MPLSNASSTSILNPKDSLSSSKLLSASMASSTSSRHGSSQISKIYRQSSTLFLTRRLPESLSTILPVITAPTVTDSNGNTSIVDHAPIANASRTTRIKVWSLYLTILNAIVELDPDEGKAAFGTQEWRGLVAKVREGAVWEEVVQNGYRGVEGDVDADVVINLATLLLAHARTQQLNQQRLENYLAASRTPNLDISDRFDHSGPIGRARRASPSKSAGTNTPRDLNARVKILELYTLHVLLRNDEWDYAREFISMSEVLDEERREAFLNALQSLEDEREESKQRERELEREREEQLQKDLEEARRKRIENEERERQRLEEQHSQRAGSEVDYGVDSSYPSHGNGSQNGSVQSRPPKSPKVASAKKAKNKVAHAPKPSLPSKKAIAPPGLFRRAGILMGNLRKLIEHMALSLKAHPMILLRTLAFIVALLLALSNRAIKERLRRITGNSWNKVRATAGMATKVSYI